MHQTVRMEAHTDVPVRSELREGRVIDGRLRLQERLGEGAAGNIWRATQLDLGLPVAIKFLAPRLRGRGKEIHVAQLLNEAELAKRVDCKHLVRVMAYALSLDMGPYIVMELLEGLDLFEHVARSGPLTSHQTASIVAQLCVALEALHGADVIHRDVKPENIVLANQGGHLCAKLIDFGVARDCRAAENDVGVPSGASGTPAYMSPERLAGSPGVEPQADLWSLAVVAYQCLVGRMPFDDKTIGATCLAVHRATIVPPSACRTDVSPRLDGWFRRSFAREPSERFTSALEMREAFIAACSPLPLESPSSYRAGWFSARAPRTSGTRPRFLVESRAFGSS
jgi:serine/threonine protein kinase